MNNRTLALAALLLVSGADAAHANPQPISPFEFFGTDSLRVAVIDVVSAAGLSASVSFQGGGSAFGGSKMSPSSPGQGPNGNQQIAPQSRFLSANECSLCENDGNGACVADPNAAIVNRGQGYVVAMNSASVLRDSASAPSCNVLRYAGCMKVEDMNRPTGSAVDFNGDGDLLDPGEQPLGYGNGSASLDDGTGSAAGLGLEDPDGDGVPSHYCFRHWADVLRIVYNGQHTHLDDSSAAAACATRTTTSSMGSKRCNSDVRWTLVSKWENMFDASGDDGAGGCANGACPNGLRHAYRPDDFSETADAFLEILGLPSLGGSVNVRTFCNGLENEDQDPVRRPCALGANPANDTDSVCAPIRFRDRNAPFGADGSPTGQAGSLPASPPPAQSVNDPSTWSDLGLVLPIRMPSQLALQYSDVFCTNAPTGGSFIYAPAPNALALSAQRCPDGTQRFAGYCRAPVGAPGTPHAGRFNCKSRRTNRPGGATWANFDARAYNLVPRDPITGVILMPNPTATTDPRWSGGGHYRIHASLPGSAGARPVCQYPDTDRQLGCLVESDACSLSLAGHAGLDPSSGPSATGNAGSDLSTTIGANLSLALRTPLDLDPRETNPGDDNELDSARANVRRVLELPGASCIAGLGQFDQRYPIGRLLWLNASKGFGPRDTALDFSAHSAVPAGFNITDQVLSSDGINSVTTNEALFARWFLDRTVLDPIACELGLITLDSSVVADTDPTCAAGSGSGVASVTDRIRFQQCGRERGEL